MSLLWAAALLFVWCAFWRARYRREGSPDEVRFARTADGWRIALSRYRPKGSPKRHPVVLCHGLGANRLTYDAGEGPSLARFLSVQGYDVWVLELRGHGLSDRPRLLGAKRWGWSFDDYLHKDLPAALDLVSQESGGAAPHFIGHSMGGDLLFAFLGSGGGARLRSGTAVGSSLDYSGSGSVFDKLMGALWLTRIFPAIPMGSLALAVSPFGGRFNSAFDRFAYWVPNIDGALARAFMAGGLHDVSSPVLAQLATAFRPGGLLSADGSRRYADGLAACRTPVLAVAGDKDEQCSPEAADRTLKLIGSPDKKLAVFGKTFGQAEHYGHVDLLMGKRAETEVFPVISAWLSRRD